MDRVRSRFVAVAVCLWAVAGAVFGQLDTTGISAAKLSPGRRAGLLSTENAEGLTIDREQLLEAIRPTEELSQWQRSWPLEIDSNADVWTGVNDPCSMKPAKPIGPGLDFAIPYEFNNYGPDLSTDCWVDLADLGLFAKNWQETGADLDGDFNEDESVDITDLCYLANHWLTAPADCNEYPAAGLPFQTSFEYLQGFVPGEWTWAHGRNGWELLSGGANIWYDSDSFIYYYQFAILEPNSVIRRRIQDNGGQHDYMRFRVRTGEGAKIEVRSDGATVAAVKFDYDPNDQPMLYVLNDGVYEPTDANMPHMLLTTQVVLEMDWENDTYAVSVENDSPWRSSVYRVHVADANFVADYSSLSEIVFTSGEDEFGLDRISISNVSDPWYYSDAMVSPCHCDEVNGSKTPIVGRLWYHQLGGYMLMYSPAELNPGAGFEDPNIHHTWRMCDFGGNIANTNTVLGYVDTALLRNGYYHFNIIPINDYGWNYYVEPDSFNTWVAVVTELKVGAFVHTAEPDIAVNWPGQLPFAVQRNFNGNRMAYAHPYPMGWTDNNQIMLSEDTRYYYTYHDDFLGLPVGDENDLAYGDILVTYPDGSRRLFRRPADGSGDFYYPYPDNDSGDHIERTSFTTGGSGVEVTAIEYVLRQLDGTEWFFSIDNLDIWPAGTLTYQPSTGWHHRLGIETAADRFGNTLSYTWDWDYENDVPNAVTRISDGRSAIEYTLNGSNYYSRVELVVDDTTYRTTYYQWGMASEDQPDFVVTKSGAGVDASGVYDSDPNAVLNTVQYIYEIDDDSQVNLKWIKNDGHFGGFGNVELINNSHHQLMRRSDLAYVRNSQNAEYLMTYFDHEYFLPDPNNADTEYLRTVTSNEYRTVTTVQNDDGALLSQSTVTADGSAAVDVENTYTFFDFKPYRVEETFDGRTRTTVNTYSAWGDLLGQAVYEDGNDVVHSEFAYHDDYRALPTKKLTWQGLNRTGQRVETLYVYGLADGTVNSSGAYLVQERVLLAEDPNEWAVTSCTYDGDTGLVIEQVDPCGVRTAYSYDDNDYGAWRWMGPADACEPVERFYHDALGQLCLQANSFGGVVRHDYDGLGRLYRVRRYEDDDALDTAVTFTPGRYDSFTPVATVNYGYDARGNRTFEEKDGGGVILTEYTRSDLPLQVTYDDRSVTWDACSVVEYAYDNRCLKTAEYFQDDPNRTGECWLIAYDYDCMDRQRGTLWYDYTVTIDDVDQYDPIKFQFTDYYGPGWKKAEWLGSGEYLETERAYAVDIFGRTVVQTLAPGTNAESVVAYGYDALGNRTSMIDPSGNVTYYTYDNNNRRTAEYFAAASGTTLANADVKKTLTYQDNGKLETVTQLDTDGTTVLAGTAFAYDERGRISELTEDIDASTTAVTEYEYSDDGWSGYEDYHVKITDAEDEVRYVGKDAFGRTVTRLYSAGDSQEIAFNGDGTLASRTVFNDAGDPCTVMFTYDGFGRRLRTVYPDDGGYVETQYDGFGRRLAVLDERDSENRIGAGMTYELDPLGQIVKITDQDDYVIEYAYRADGQKAYVGVTEPVNQSGIYRVQYDFDEAGRPVTAYDPNKTVYSCGYAMFEYDENGNRSRLGYFATGNLLLASYRVDYTFDRQNRLTGYTTSGGPTFSLASTTIDGLGRLTGGTETVEKVNGTTVAHVHSYGYDRRSQLTTAAITNVGQTTWTGGYAYFKDGNIYQKTCEGSTSTYSYDGDLLTGATGGDSFSLTHDDNGQMTTSPGATLNFDWDGKLHDAAFDGDTLDCRYDPDGNRIWKIAYDADANEVVARRFIVDPVGDLATVLVEIVSSNAALDPGDWDPNDGAVAGSYVYLNAQPLVMFEGDFSADRYFYLHDRLGSVRAVIDAAGDVVARYAYSPYGQTLTAATEEGELENPWRFTGQYYDGEIEQYYLRARQYDLTAGRFVSRDPVYGSHSEPLTLHAYLYCLNNPVNRFDPSGQISIASTMSAVGKGMQLYSYYATGVTLKGYFEQIANGVSIRSVMMGAAFDVALNMAAGQALGFLTKAATPAFTRIGRGIANYAKKNAHHIIPKWAGGWQKQILHLLGDTQHRELEKIIRKKMKQKHGIQIGGQGGGYDDIWIKFLDDSTLQPKVFQELMDIYADFDLENGTHLLEGFFENFAAGFYDKM